MSNPKSPKVKDDPTETTQVQSSPASSPCTSLVVGGGGFLGRHLCARLIERGDQVVSFSRRRHDALHALGVQQVQGNALEIHALMEHAQDCDELYWLAGRVSRESKDSGLMYDLHIQGARVLTQLVEQLDLKRVLFLSTSGTVGISDSADSIADDHDAIAWNQVRHWPYYESKAFAEEEIWRAVARGLPIKVARPSLFLGPDDPNGDSHQDILTFLSGQVKAALPGGLSAVDVRDVAYFLPILMDRGELGTGYLLGAENISIRSFLNQIAQLVDRPPPLLDLSASLVKRGGYALKWISKQSMFGGIDPQTFDMGSRFWYINSDRAKALGFQPRPLWQTLKDAIDDLEARGFII